MVKRYAPERGSEWVKSIIESNENNKVYIGQVGVVEIASALSKKVRTKELSKQDYEAALVLFLMDVQNEEYIVSTLSDKVIEVAVNMTRRYPLRAYDAVHLATATNINAALMQAGLPSVIFVSADITLCEAAKAEGLSVDDPNDH